MDEVTYKLTERLRKDLVIQGKEDLIMADTAVKLMNKLHQLYSGTIKFESGKSKVIDYTKAQFIFEKFEGKKIGIFYKFKAEYDALKDVFGDQLTGDINEFNDTDKNIALQFLSGREGISLRKADFLVTMNIDFSATTYFQFRDRMSTQERPSNTLFWVFTKGGIEESVYKKVLSKKNFTVSHFKREYLK